MRRRIFLAVIAGAAAAAVAGPSALAQGAVCCRAVAVPPVAYAPVVAPYVSAPYYIVNQGPVYSGPGIFTRPTYIPNNATFAPYPYVYAPGVYAPAGYGPPPYVRSFHQPRGAIIGRRPPHAGAIDMRRHYGRFGPPMHRPVRPPYHAAPPSGADPQPRMVPPLPPQRPAKPVPEKWTQGLPSR